jgi:hypothetical protein
MLGAAGFPGRFGPGSSGGLGPDLLGGAGSFDSATGWTQENATATIAAGVCTIVATTNGQISYLVSIPAGSQVVATWTQTVVSGSPQVQITLNAADTGGAVTGSGTFTRTIAATANRTKLWIYTAASGSVSIDDLTVRIAGG